MIQIFNKVACVALLLLLFACGKKDDPQPKTAVEVPLPDVSVELTEEGVHIANRSTEYIVMIERAESEIGDLSLPKYAILARLQPSDNYTDSEVDKDRRYLYRFRSYYFRYNAYSGYVTQAVSYRGPIELDSVEWRFAGDNLCVKAELSPSTASAEVRLNGMGVGDYTSGDRCYPMPPTVIVLLMIVPYSDSGTPGTVYSESIARDTSVTLLPPQNVKLIRREANLTISWDEMLGASGYIIRGKGWTKETQATLITVPATLEGCSSYTISTLRNGRESQRMDIQSCQ